MSASDQMIATLDTMFEQYGETVTAWPSTKGLAGSTIAGHRSPTPSEPFPLSVLYRSRKGGKSGGSAKIYLSAEDMAEQGLVSPDNEWRIQREGLVEQMSIEGEFEPLGANGITTWWVGTIKSGGSDHGPQ